MRMCGNSHGQLNEIIVSKSSLSGRDRLLTPESIPPADISLDRLPATLNEAATAAIDVEGYCRAEEEAEGTSGQNALLTSVRRSPSGSGADENRPTSRKSRCPDNGKPPGGRWDGSLSSPGVRHEKQRSGKLGTDRRGGRGVANLAD